MQSSTICSEINLIKHGDREQLIVIVVLFNKVWWLCFFFFFPHWRLGHGSRWKSRGGDRERNMQSNSCVIQQSLVAVAFFFLLPLATWPWRWKSRGGDRERNVQRESERERES